LHFSSVIYDYEYLYEEPKIGANFVMLKEKYTMEAFSAVSSLLASLLAAVYIHKV